MVRSRAGGPGVDPKGAHAAAESALSIAVVDVVPLERIADAHDMIETGNAAGRVLVSLP
jgi:hypothetical protein